MKQRPEFAGWGMLTVQRDSFDARFWFGPQYLGYQNTLASSFVNKQNWPPIFYSITKQIFRPLEMVPCFSASIWYLFAIYPTLTSRSCCCLHCKLGTVHALSQWGCTPRCSFLRDKSCFQPSTKIIFNVFMCLRNCHWNLIRALT